MMPADSLAATVTARSVRHPKPEFVNPAMLRTIRASASSWVVKILFLILVASFAVWGIGDIFRGPSRSTAVAEVGGIAIGGEQFLREFRRETGRLQALFGGQFDEEQARRMGLDRRVLEDMITRTLFNVYAGEIGLTVPNDVIVQRIRSDPTFRNDLGVFDRARFNFLLQQNGLTEQDYIALLRRDLAREQLLNAVTGGVTAPETLVTAVHRYRTETRVAETLMIPNESITDIGEPTEDELAAFHKEHEDRYQAPEYRSVTIVELSPAALAQEIKVSEEDLRTAYEERADELAVPERRHVEQIVFPDEAAAKAAADMLRDGVAFAEVARRTTGGEPVDLGTVERAGMLQELAEGAFATPEGQVSEPVESPLGWHLLHVIEVQDAHAPSFEEVRDRLREDIAMDRAVETVIELANAFEDELAGGATLDEAARTLNLDLTKIDAVSAAGRAPDGSKIPAIADRPVLLSLAFSTPEGETSGLTETADGGYAMLRVDGLTPRMLRPLEEVRSRVVADWQAAQRAEAAREKAEAIAERVRAGEDLAAIAGELGLSVKTSDPFRRDTGDAEANVPADLAADLFQLEEGGVATGEADEGHVVARLIEIRPADADADSPEVAKLRRDISDAMAGDVLAQFGDALRRKIEVRVNQDAIDALF